MASLGIVYWGLERYNNTNILYLSGTSNIPSRVSSSNKGVWNQRATDIVNPWDNTNVSANVFITDDPYNGKYNIEILSEIRLLTGVGLFCMLPARYGTSGQGDCRAYQINGSEYINCSECVSTHSMYSGVFLTESVLNSISYLNTYTVTDMSYMFYYASRLPNTLSEEYILDLSNLQTDNVTNMSYMFSSCEADILDITGFNTSKVTTMNSMFAIMNYIRSIDVSSFTIESLVNTGRMFDMTGTNGRLATIYAHPNANWSSSSILTNSSDMFKSCISLVGGNGTQFLSSKTNKERARIDKDGQVGYFTIATRTISTSYTGTGTITGSGTYNYGTEVTVVATPGNGYYAHSFLKDSSVEILSGDTISPTTYKFIITRNASFAASYIQRQTRTLSVTQEGTSYTIEGAGSYKYLDNPTLIADLNEGLIAFLGWYSGDEAVSTQNPYSFVMPDANVSLLAKFGSTPFSDEKVRQFILRNRNGELYRLTDHNSNIFLNKPSGLGYSKEISTVRYGNSLDVPVEQFTIPKISGDLYFHSEGIEDIYTDYYDFVRFSVKKPIMLWYKIPVRSENESDISNVYHIPVEITTVKKTELEENGSLISGIEFQGTGFWKHTTSRSDIVSASVSVLNKGDLDSGVEITVQKGDSTAFSNPVITFSDVNGEYGMFALDGTFTKVYFNTIDKDQNITLWNGSETPLDNPFSYIDFNKADGIKIFPFPKLKNGSYTTISFSYDGIGQESQNFVVIYDEEYVSV